MSIVQDCDRLGRTPGILGFAVSGTEKHSERGGEGCKFQQSGRKLSNLIQCRAKTRFPPDQHPGSRFTLHDNKSVRLSPLPQTGNRWVATGKKVPVRVYQSFHDFPKSLVDGNSYPSQQNYFLSNQWFSNLYETVLRIELDLRVYALFPDESENEIEGVLFCGRLKSKRILVSLTNYYTIEYGPVLFDEKSDSISIIDHFVDYISTETPAWESVELRCLRSDTRQYGCFVGRFRSAGFYANGYFQYENWYYPMNGKDFSAYYKERPLKLKNTIKRKAGKLRNSHNLEIKYFTENDAELETGINAYTSVYNNSWKKSEPYTDFISELIKSCAKQGILFLGILCLNSKPVAAQLWLSTANKFIIYKLSYDEEYKNLSVGSILSKDMFEEAFKKSECSEIDYGIGSEPYKQDWMSRVRPIGGIRAYNKKTFNGFLLAIMQQMKAGIKKFLPI
ncbi:MAG: GNAT family N-acetyltransferase [Methylococcales bacterium]